MINLLKLHNKSSDQSLKILSPIKYNAYIYEALIRSGILQVKETSRHTYELSLTTSVLGIDINKGIEVLSKIYPDILDIYIPPNISTMDLDMIKQNQELLDMIHKYLDIKIIMKTNNSKINSIHSSVDIILENIMNESPLGMFLDTEKNIHINNLLYTNSAKMAYTRQSLNYTINKNNIIDLNKFIQAMEGYQSQLINSFNLNSNLDTWDFQDEFDEYDNNTTDLSTWMDLENDLYLDKNNSQTLLKNINDNDWFSDYAYDLVNKGVIRKQATPLKNVTAHDLEVFIQNAGGVLPLNFTNNNKDITKLHALKIIIKSFHPEQKNPVRFAMNQGIIPKNWSIKTVKNQMLYEAELYKILAITLSPETYVNQ